LSRRPASASNSSACARIWRRLMTTAVDRTGAGGLLASATKPRNVRTRTRRRRGRTSCAARIASSGRLAGSAPRARAVSSASCAVATRRRTRTPERPSTLPVRETTSGQGSSPARVDSVIF
jgi:hypothetical protein